MHDLIIFCWFHTNSKSFTYRKLKLNSYSDCSCFYKYYNKYSLVIMHQLHNHVMLCLWWSKCTLLGKYGVDYLHVSPNCHYILSSISKSHGSPKTNFTALKKNHLVKNSNICFWETKGQSTLVITFDLTFMGYTW